MTAATLLLGQLLAFWPVMAWYTRRSFDGSDDSWGVLAWLLAVAVLLLEARATSGRVGSSPERSLWPAAAVTLVYALSEGVSSGGVPSLIMATLAVLALSLTASAVVFGRVMHPAFTGLALLSLPIIASLQFYVGYPLRRVATELAAALLSPIGQPIEAIGVTLRIAGRTIEVDAPCSGLRMLWVAAFLVFALGLVRQVSTRRLLAGGGLALILVVVANGLRAAALAVLEGLGSRAPEWAHPVVGLTAFAIALVPIVAFMSGGVPVPRPSYAPLGTTRSRRVFLLACGLAAAAPLFSRGAPGTGVTSFPGWPDSLESRALIALPLSPRETAFARSFPGEVGRFHDGLGEVILRYVTAPTRRLHPAADCFRGLGYSIGAPELWRDEAGQEWRIFHATRDGEGLRVRERIHDELGQSFTDASAWYWAALMGRTRAPWWSVVIAR